MASHLCCPHCLDTALGGLCSCGLSQPWEVSAYGKAESGGTQFIMCHIKCIGCGAERRAVPIMRQYITPLAELESFVNDQGFVCSKKWCPDKHAGYQVGIMKTTSHTCPACGHIDEQPVRGGPDIQGNRMDGESFRRSVMGA